MVIRSVQIENEDRQWKLVTSAGSWLKVVQRTFLIVPSDHNRYNGCSDHGVKD
jgi:hypothetical protein